MSDVPIFYNLETAGDVTAITGELSDLETTLKTNLVTAINEINGKFPVAIANGGTGGTTATLARTNLGVMTQTVLYNNASGSDSTIPLSDSIANYDHIGVYYYSEASVTGCAFYTEFPTSQSSVLLCAIRSNDARTSLLCKSVKTDWVTDTVTFTAPTEVQIKTSSVTFAENHGIKIFKIIGYNF